MDGNTRNFLKQRSNPQFKKKGGTKKANRNYSNHEPSSESAQASDTVYRILCQSKRIGSVIGKGGNIIKSLRAETQAKISVADSVPGSDERVITIFSSSRKLAGRQDTDDSNEIPLTREENGGIEPHCAAQDALLKVHDRIVEEDLIGAEDEDGKESLITTRLLVANSLVGCLLGKKGDVIQRLRSETGASIRVFPADQIPACAMANDELVQISGKPGLVRKALYEVSTLLHQNPRKDKAPLSFPVAHGAQGFHPPGRLTESMLPPGNPMWSRRSVNLNSMPPVAGVRGYGNQPSGMGRGDFETVPSPRAKEDPAEFTMKILCSAAKIGGVIGKGGNNVKQLQQETGASIHVEDVSPESDERVIRVSSLEAPWDPRSQTIDAILQLQRKTSEISDKGIITIRLLVPSSKVGCILGQGGQVINEMRRRTQADIRVFSKEDKPKCATTDEELVQISGSFGVAKDALEEISSRLRARCLRDANDTESAPVRPLPRFGPSTDIPTRDPRLSGVMRAGSSNEYELLKVGGSRPRFQDPRSVGSGFIDDIRRSSDNLNARHNVYRGSSEHLNAGQNMYQGFDSSSGQSLQSHYHHSYDAPQSGYQSHNAQGGYQSYNAQGGYQSHNAQGGYQSYNAQGGYQNYDAQGGYPSISPSRSPYQNINPHQAPYRSINMQQQQQQPSYQNMSAQGSYRYSG